MVRGARAITVMLAAAWQVAVIAAPDKGAALIASSSVAVVPTAAGAVQGFIHHGVYTWRGIPYARADRFMPPEPALPWQGVRMTLSWGDICPQPVSPELREPQTFISDDRYWPQSEACQNLNIWSPAPDGKGRPVMVWLHGGGFFSGSSMELALYDGTNLARKGDVVIVSINHRLNSLGFLDLTAYGPRYADSANVGMLDIVAALRWVRINIASFGGDPANVTIFGQSGGGQKVATLMAAGLAKGLFARAIIQSGAPGGLAPAAIDQVTTRRVAELTLKNAGLSPASVGELATMPYDALTRAAQKALIQVSAEKNGSRSGLLGFPTVNWGPVVDNRFLTDVPFLADAPAVSKGVPLMVGSTLAEFGNLDPTIAGHDSWTEAQVRTWLARTRGPQADALLAAYRKAYPDLAPGVWPTIDTRLRAGTLLTARQKAAEGDPTWVFLTGYRSPVLDYAWAAGHSTELGLIFDNPDLAEQALGGGPVVDRLAAEMSSAWLNFARTGDPNGRGVPHWPRFTPERPATMIFDARDSVRVGHDADLIKLSTPPPSPAR